jgi:amino acid adenylation domain-containing protein
MGEPATYVFPASFAQDRLWFLEQLVPDLGLYNINMNLDLNGSLAEYGRFNPELLERALARIVRRHETLRTSLRLQNGALVQVIHEQVPVAVARTDLLQLPPGERGRELERVASDDAARPFALERPPLWRARLVRLDDDDWRLLLIIHHTTFDGGSVELLIEELVETYGALAAGRPPQRPELPVQYADFAVWQRKQLTEGVLDPQLEYWRAQLAGLPDDIGLPTDRPRPAHTSYRGGLLAITLPAQITPRLTRLAQETGATLFMTLLAAFKAVLARYAGHTDVVVGCPVGGREAPELKGLIGVFVNMLVMRTDLGGDPTFRELVGRVRATALDAFDHQDVPFERLVETLQTDRDPGRPPLHQVVFNLLPIDGGGHYGNGTAKVDLNLELWEEQGRLEGYIEYSRDLYDEPTVRRLAASYTTLLAAAVDDPDQPISRLPVLTGEERQQILAGWNATVGEVPQRCLHELVAEQASGAPDALAVLAPDGQRLTYQELDQRANRLAWRLRQLGVGTEDRVAVCLPRSAELVVALLAVHKAGGCYVPLDPDYPAGRLRHMLTDSGASLLVTAAELLARLPTPHPELLTLDGASLDDQPSTPPPGEATPEQLAYVIYTSGSTGRPKGVMVPHRGVVNLIWDVRAAPGLRAGDSFLFLTSLSFDISALEVFGPLITGGTVVVAGEVAVHAAGQVRQAIQQGLVTTVQATPSVLQALLGELPPDLPRVIAGGEPLPSRFANQVLQVAGELWNFYGPTETTIWSCKYPVPRGVTAMSIGRPLANTQAYVLDAGLQPVPVGVPGELYLGGAGVARGYWGRPALTAERFLPDPFGGQPGARLYRTGDLARWRPDGTLEFLGRLDNQVKVRGVRTELGEVEAALAEHELVRRAVAAVREDAPGGRGLVAYVDWAGEESAATGELRAHLRSRLPEAMIPVAYVPVEAFPVLPNGKLDRAVLPAPSSQDRAGLETGYVAPRTPMEEELCNLWRELLGRDQIGVEDDFFALGGQSLLATQLVARVRELFGVELPLRRCFEISTVAEYALAILELQLEREGGGDVGLLLDAATDGSVR